MHDGEEPRITGDDLARLVDVLSQAIAQASIAVDLVRRALRDASGIGARTPARPPPRGPAPPLGPATLGPAPMAGPTPPPGPAPPLGSHSDGHAASSASSRPLSRASSHTPWRSSPVLPARHSREVYRALRYIEAHYEEMMSLARLARVADCSRRQLAAAFLRETGETVHAHLTRVRLTRAALHVRAGDKVEAVMLGVGYRGKRNFYRQFKAQFGMTPCAYRERARDAHELAAAESTLARPVAVIPASSERDDDGASSDASLESGRSSESGGSRETSSSDPKGGL